MAFSTSGCGFSFSIPSLVADEAPTGSIRAKPVSPLSPSLDAEDWRRASSALAVALDPVGNGSPAKWGNPESGAQGIFTPDGLPFVKEDEICRSFLATFTVEAVQQSQQGTACRPSGGAWTINDLKPQKKPG
jgi:17 kDa outer membrane surface antigen